MPPYCPARAAECRQPAWPGRAMHPPADWRNRPSMAAQGALVVHWLFHFGSAQELQRRKPTRAAWLQGPAARSGEKRKASWRDGIVQGLTKSTFEETGTVRFAIDERPPPIELSDPLNPGGVLHRRVKLTGVR